ncbi:MAG: lipoyl(octanoyl) transferase LipB [Burkholderiales bacterium]|nr:lipoyl(octanoyl) transferase LipB [Burkholderiales bacterium]
MRSDYPSFCGRGARAVPIYRVSLVSRLSTTPFSSAPVSIAAEPPVVRRPGLVPYVPTWERMREFTLARTDQTPDELWLLEHPPVYTVGIAGKTEHWPRIDNGIPVVRVDRGGQITYHGPGQLVAYLLLDMRRRGLTIRPLVRLMEQAVIKLLADYGIEAQGRNDAPGVYVGAAKIAALGLRVKNGCCYHGLALNVDVDLDPFHAINPCGYAGLEVTSTRRLGITDSKELIAARLIQHLQDALK